MYCFHAFLFHHFFPTLGENIVSYLAGIHTLIFLAEFHSGNEKNQVFCKWWTSMAMLKENDRRWTEQKSRGKEEQWERRRGQEPRHANTRKPESSFGALFRGWRKSVFLESLSLDHDRWFHINTIPTCPWGI